MTIDFSVQQKLEDAKRNRETERSTSERGPGSGGGKPPSDGDMDQRIKALEASIASIDKALAVISEQLKHVASNADLMVVSAKLDLKANATELAELKGRIARIPTVPVLTSILVFVSLLFAAGTWVLRHLPPAWANAFQ